MQERYYTVVWYSKVDLYSFTVLLDLYNQLVQLVDNFSHLKQLFIYLSLKTYFDNDQLSTISIKLTDFFQKGEFHIGWSLTPR